MTFNLEWADEPKSGGVTGSYEATVLYTRSDGSMKWGSVTHYVGPGYYNANNYLWWGLLDTMAELGMVGEIPADGPIPMHKLCSNDGAHVLPTEISRALLVCDKKAPLLGGLLEDDEDPESARAVWDEWVAWLRTAALHGGFRVN